MPPSTPPAAELHALPSDTAAVIDLANREAIHTAPEPYDLTPATAVTVVRLRADERLQNHDLSAHLPSPPAPIGSAEVRHPDDFAQLVNRLANLQHTTVWADEDRSRITAVINDHANDADAGWRDHRVTLTLTRDPDWQRWMAADGKLFDQDEFAEFVEDSHATVVSPDPATMLEVALSFRAHKDLAFEQHSRMDNGDVHLSYVETTSASAGVKGQLEVPEHIGVQLSPWIGADPIALRARLRYRITNRQLRIGYRLHRPDLAQTTAFAALVAQVRAALTEGLPVFLGPAPEQLRTKTFR